MKTLMEALQEAQDSAPAWVEKVRQALRSMDGNVTVDSNRVGDAYSLFVRLNGQKTSRAAVKSAGVPDLNSLVASRANAALGDEGDVSEVGTKLVIRYQGWELYLDGMVGGIRKQG